MRLQTSCCSCCFWQRSVPATEVRPERAIAPGKAAQALQYDAKSAEVQFWARMSQKRIAFRALSAKTCQNAKKGKKTLTEVNLVCRYKLFCVKRRASSLAFKKATKEQVWTLVRDQSACALALKRSRAAVKARDDRLGRTRE